MRTRHEPPAQLLAVQLEVQLTVGERLGGILGHVERPGAAIPHDHVTAAVLTFGDHALEVEVLERMVLDVHREVTLTPGSRVSPFGTAQLDQHAADLQPEVVVQAAGPVLLHHEARRAFGVGAEHLARGLGRAREVALLVIPVQGAGRRPRSHGSSLPVDRRVHAPRPRSHRGACAAVNRGTITRSLHVGGFAMPRSIWTGSISFGLVNIPVKAYSAIRAHDVHFHLLAPDGSRVHNQRVSEKSGKVVEYAELKKGYETSKGKYAVFEQDELKALARRDEDDRHRGLRAARGHRPDLLRADVPPRAAMTRPPRGLRAARRRDGGPTARRHRQGRDAREAVPRRGPALRQGSGAVDDALRRRGRAPVRRRRGPRAPRQGQRPREALADQIVDSLEPTWKPERYHDDYEEELREIIKAKQKGKLETVTEDRAAAGEGARPDGGVASEPRQGHAVRSGRPRPRRRSRERARNTSRAKTTKRTTRRPAAKRRRSSQLNPGCRCAPVCHTDRVPDQQLQGATRG